MVDPSEEKALAAAQSLEAQSNMTNGLYSASENQTGQTAPLLTLQMKMGRVCECSELGREEESVCEGAPGPAV